MQRIAKEPIENEKIQKGLDVYLHASQAKNAYRVMLKRDEELDAYVQLLKAIKLPLNKIGLRIYPSDCFNKTEDELKTHWTGVFQKAAHKKVLPASIIVYSGISTREKFGQIELDPVHFKDRHKEFLEHYQHAIYFIAVLFLAGK